MILGLDWGSTTGIAVLTLDGDLSYTGTITRSPAVKARPATAKTPGRAQVTTDQAWGWYTMALRVELEGWCRDLGVSVLALEFPGHLRTLDQAGAYWRARAVCEEVSYRRGVQLVHVPTGRVKLTATGYGRAEKEAMIAAAVARWGDRDWIEHTADAAWIAETARVGGEK